MEFTEEEKKALLKKPKKAKKSRGNKSGQKQGKPQSQLGTKPKSVPKCVACGGEHWFESGGKYLCTDKAAAKKHLLEQAAKFN